jgi:transmembrane secretion effector
LIFLRNGALLYRVDENLENPGTFRTEMLVASWGEHERQLARTTKAETEIAEQAWNLHAGESEPVVRHYIQANRVSTPLGLGHFRKQSSHPSPKGSETNPQGTKADNLSPHGDRTGDLKPGIHQAVGEEFDPNDPKRLSPE